jgi:hypothetical protein
MPFRTLAAPALLAALAALASGPALAQPVLDFVEELDDDRPEAWAMRWFSAALEPTGFGAPVRRDAGAIGLGFEAGWLPELSEEERTVGFSGTKTEELNRTPVIGRVRVDVGLGAGFTLGAGWIPPLELDGAKGNLLSAWLARPLVETPRFRLGATLVATTGRIDGDFTCDRGAVEAGDDPARNPYACEEVSEDEIHFDAFGAELAAAYLFGGPAETEAHVGIGYRRLDSEFRADARWGGLVDRSVLLYDGADVSIGAGASWRTSDRTRFAGEVVYVPLDVVRDPLDPADSENDALLNVRLLLTWRAR